MLKEGVVYEIRLEWQPNTRRARATAQAGFMIYIVGVFRRARIVIFHFYCIIQQHKKDKKREEEEEEKGERRDAFSVNLVVVSAGLASKQDYHTIRLVRLSSSSTYNLHRPQ